MNHDHSMLTFDFQTDFSERAQEQWEQQYAVMSLLIADLKSFGDWESTI